MSEDFFGEDEAVEDPNLEWKLCAAALPAMLVLAVLFQAFPMGHFVQRTFLSMPVHELGHAVAAWFGGFWAIPTLWHTNVAESRGLVMPLLLLIGLGVMIRRAWRAENFVLAGLAATLLLIQAACTIFMAPEKARMLIVFGGDGAGMLIAAALMMSFYLGKGASLYQGGLRWGFIAIGAAAWVDMFSTWWAARRDSGKIPFGEQEGGALSDATRLVDEFGWSADELVRRHVTLGLVCMCAVLAVYAWGTWRAYRSAQE